MGNGGVTPGTGRRSDGHAQPSGSPASKGTRSEFETELMVVGRQVEGQGPRVVGPLLLGIRRFALGRHRMATFSVISLRSVLRWIVLVGPSASPAGCRKRSVASSASPACSPGGSPARSAGHCSCRASTSHNLVHLGSPVQCSPSRCIRLVRGNFKRHHHCCRADHLGLPYIQRNCPFSSHFLAGLLPGIA